MSEDNPELLAAVYALLYRPHLSWTIQKETEYPSRPQLREQLVQLASSVKRWQSSISKKKLDEAAQKRVFKLLASIAIHGLLSNGDKEVAANLLWVRDPDQISALTAAALERTSPKQGRGRLYPVEESAPDAAEYCARITSVAWKIAVGVWPGQRHPKVLAICELLWRQAGGEAHKIDNGFEQEAGRYLVWRRHIIDAKRYRPPHSAGTLVESGLTAISRSLKSTT